MENRNASPQAKKLKGRDRNKQHFYVLGTEHKKEQDTGALYGYGSKLQHKSYTTLVSSQHIHNKMYVWTSTGSRQCPCDRSQGNA